MEKKIEDEIKKNGNTNFIADSGFETGQQIFAIGDSHSIFFFNSIKIKEHWFFCNSKKQLPLSIYTLLRDNLDIYNIGNILENGHEFYNIKKNDFVLMNFGFNDIQRNIYLHASNKWKEEINNLINKYIEAILIFKKKFEIIPIVSFIYPNPGPNAKGQNSMGSFEERSMYTIEANTILKNKCMENNILFFDIYDFVTDENGTIKKSFTIDDIHLDYNNKFLREFVDNKIIELCKITL